MSNIYLTVTKRKISKLRFPKLKKFVSRSVFGELQFTQISLNFKTSCCNLKIRCLGAKLCVAFLLFWFWEGLWRFKVKESMLYFWTKICTLIETRRNRKWKIPRIVLERWNLWFSSNKNSELKVKPWWVRAHQRKQSALFVTFVLSEENFLTFAFYLHV